MGTSGAGTIRRRIVRTLALPVAATLALLAVITVDEVGGYRAAATTARAVTLDLAVQALVQELQTERGLTAGLLGGNAGFADEIIGARQRVDRQRAAVEQLITGDGPVERRVDTALRQLDGLAGVRAGTDTGAGARPATFAFYTGRIAGLSQVDFGLDTSVDAELRRGVAALAALGEVKEATAQERAFLNGVFSASGFHDGEYLQFVAMRVTKDAALRDFARYATPAAQASRDYLLDTGAAREAAYFEQVALKSGDERYLQVNPQSWWSALTTVLDDVLRLEQHVGSVIRARAETLQEQATVRLGLLTAAVLICLAGSVYLATVASRSVARPLALLAGEADRLASAQLPEAVRLAAAGDDAVAPAGVRVPSRSGVEVRLVADAFDRVQATAYALATEQARLRRATAESLANLGRRNQNLLRRQLGFISKLEREESSPAGLANLFELDHLATRMRRSAESLLVLVGAVSPRQWSEPLPVADVIRAAVSEVEEYRRVALRRIDDALVAGSVVAGIAHLLAELIENGLTFSPPDVDVEIHGRMLGDTYLIAVTDQGVGMSAADIARANERLRGEGDFISAPARFLGHFVVGRLATEMGIEVQLTPSPVTGVTARVALGAGVLAVPPAVPAAEPRRVAAETFPAPRLGLPPGENGQQVRAAEVDYVVVPDPPPVPQQRAPAETIPFAHIDAAPAAHGGVTHTANGLRRRTPRERRAPATGPAAAPEPGRPAPPEVPLSGSPEKLRERLTALRDGVRRGDVRQDRP